MCLCAKPCFGNCLSVPRFHFSLRSQLEAIGFEMNEPSSRCKKMKKGTRDFSLRISFMLSKCVMTYRALFIHPRKGSGVVCLILSKWREIIRSFDRKVFYVHKMCVSHESFCINGVVTASLTTLTSHFP